jgi:hypothetical protein
MTTRERRKMQGAGRAGTTLRRSSGPRSRECEPDPLGVSLEALVREKRRQFAAQRARVPTLRAEAAALRAEAAALTGRAAIRRQKDLERRADALEREADAVASGETERLYEERVVRYIEAYRWTQAEERWLSRKRGPSDEDISEGEGEGEGTALPRRPPKRRCYRPDARGKEKGEGEGEGEGEGGGGGGGGRDAPDSGEGAAKARAKGERGAAAPPPSAPSALPNDRDTALQHGLQRQRALIVREYLTEFEGHSAPMHLVHQDLCRACDEPLLLSVNGSLMVCPRCGCGYPYIDTTTASMSYGEEVEFSSFTYKKVHHFDDWLKRIQNKGTKRAEPWVLDIVMKWHYDKGYTSATQIRRDTVRHALKENGLRRYYEYDMQIYCRITNQSPPYMTPEQEEICRLMFASIQAPYVKWKAVIDPKRRNFLSYSLCLYLFCMLLGWHEFLPYFSLLKGVDKLQKQLLIWRGITRDLQWDFVPPPGVHVPPLSADMIAAAEAMSPSMSRP